MKMIELLYLGESVHWTGKIHQKFRDKKGKEHFWTKRKFVYFGESYLCSKEYTMERSPEKPKKQTLFATQDDEKNYEASKLACIQARANLKKVMQLKKPHADIVHAIALLRPFFRAIDFNTETRFIKYLHNEFTKKGKK